MTPEEAIWLLNHVDAHGIVKQAKQMAIEALKKHPGYSAVILIGADMYGFDHSCSHCWSKIDNTTASYCWYCGAKFKKEDTDDYSRLSKSGQSDAQQAD